MNWRNETAGLLRPLAETPRLGVVCDLDGTLSHITARPQDAQISPRNLELLTAFQDCAALVAVVSGRSAADLVRRVGLQDVTYIGNHGLEQWMNGQVVPVEEARIYDRHIADILAEIRPHMMPGMQIEDKVITASIHYRQSPDPEAVEQVFLPLIEQAAQVHQLRFFRGRKIFELRPPLEIDKGTALQKLVDEHQLGAVVFLGDDNTDAHALAMARELRAQNGCYAVGLGVESDATPESVLASADVLASGVDDVEAFLEWLLTARKASSICD